MLPFKTSIRPFRFVALMLFVFAAPSLVSAEEQIDQVVKIVSDDWSSLEIIKLLIELLTPAAMLYIGLWFDRRIKEFEHRQWSNQKVIEKRLEVYEKVTPKLNDMMCYFLRIGTWKELDPKDVVDMKREIDKDAHIYAPLFSPRFMENYNAFMAECFATFRGAGKDAQLRADASSYRDAFVGEDGQTEKWQSEWDDCFTGAEEATTREAVSASYRLLVGCIAEELGVGNLNVHETKFTDKSRVN